MKNILLNKKELILKQKNIMDEEYEELLTQRYLIMYREFDVKLMDREEINNLIKIKFEKIKNCIRKIFIDDYNNWLSGFLDNGGKITHFYNYSFDFNNWFCVIGDCEWEIPLFGSNSCNFIILNSVDFKFNEKECGHINFYFMGGFKHIGNCVPFYKNMLKGIFENEK